MDHGSNNLRQAKSLVEGVANQQKQSSNFTTKGISIGFKQVSKTDRGLDARYTPKLLVKVHTYDERSKSLSFPPPTYGGHSASLGASVFRFMYHSKGYLDIVGGDNEMGQLVKVDYS